MANLNEQTFALRMRRVIRREISSMIDEIRPKPQYGKIVAGSVNLIGNKAIVLLNGATESLPCYFTPGIAPHPGQTDVVEVQRINRTYWITRIISSGPVSPGVIANDRQLEIRRSLAIDPPDIGSGTTLIARFNAVNAEASELAVARLLINQYQNFGSWSVRTYQHLFEANSLSTSWVTIAPVASEKIGDAEVLTMKIRQSSIGDSFELGITRSAGISMTPGPYYFDITVGGVSWTWDSSFSPEL